MTKLQSKTANEVRKWCQGQDWPDPITLVRHIHPRAYVIGYAAQCCLVVAVPWPDSEPQMQLDDLACPLKLVHTFDHSLRAGHWCSVAYVCHGSCGESVAVPVVRLED